MATEDEHRRLGRIDESNHRRRWRGFSLCCTVSSLPNNGLTLANVEAFEAKTHCPVALLSAVAVTAKKAETYSPETYVIDLADLRQILFELQDYQVQKT